MAENTGTGKYEALFYSLNHIELIHQPCINKSGITVFQDNTLIIVKEGQGQIMLDGAYVPLEQGAGVLLESGMLGRIESGEGGISFYQLKFEIISRAGYSISLIDTPSNSGLIRCGMVTCQPFSQCLLLLDSLYQKRCSTEEIEGFASHTRFQELLLLIFRANPPAPMEQNVKSGVQRTIDYVKENYKETLTVDQLAAMAGTSRSRYTQLFKEITGQLPLDYMNAIRIEHAQQLLLLTSDRLYDIAQAVGYSNEYYFNRRFKGTIGIAPGQYRRYQQQDRRIFAPFLEDHLLALGIVPVVQYSHALWGKQDYLGLNHVPEFDISSGDWGALSDHKPELIMLDNASERWSLEQCRQIAPLFKLPLGSEDWRSTLRFMAAICGRADRVRDITLNYEHKAQEASSLLRRSVRTQTVAVLRISACAVVLYGCGELGYIGNVLYRDLGLQSPPLVQKWTRGERRVNLTREMLSRLNADHLFITFDKQEGEGRELLDTPLWRSLPAVRNRCVYEVDFMAWMNYGVLSHSRKIDDVLKVLA
ncbi:AraC family transcriptional regulator [Paenibacillus monticola]|uniref:Helix-turn-helix domain-containing protein n=1 Tax=Paenibacillus monticola TaxID=2666075 RepID=A0A7X2L0B7_9BACL|nr:AraC family transcriptional regulator [Paenibacillus monticola]MRN52567.1 helix-turn-helix domain-containing protein [Paenibacillus monticola]